MSQPQTQIYSDKIVGKSARDVIDWSPPSRKPTVAGFFATKERLENESMTRRVLFTGNFWMTERPVAAWRPLTIEEKLSQDASFGVLIDKDSKDKDFDNLSLVPIEQRGDIEMQSLKKLSALELRVEVVKFSAPIADANGTSTGMVLAVSANYSAQQTEGDHVTVHENKRLSKPLIPGEDTTLTYQNGTAVVQSGIAHDIKIVAPWMPRDQQGYLRMVMFDALSAMKSPQSDDDKLRDAMRYALESTANFFGVKESKLRVADINLVVNEHESVIPFDPGTAVIKSTVSARRP